WPWSGSIRPAISSRCRIGRRAPGTVPAGDRDPPRRPPGKRCPNRRSPATIAARRPDTIPRRRAPSMTDLVTPVPTGKPTFAGLPRCEDIASLDAHIAIIGVPYGIPASMEASRAPSSEAPDAIRAESLRFGKYFDHHDIDLGGPILAGRDIRVVDCGDVSMRPGDNAANSATTTEAIRAIRAAGAVPFILGGDHSIPIPVMRAYDDIGTMCVVQFDAHLDYRDEVNGVKEGLSSSIRRASELDYVGDIVQIGLRGLGSARDQDVQDAMDRRNIFITAAEMYKNGLDEVTKRLPQADNYYITFDM